MDNRTGAIGPEIWRDGDRIVSHLCGGFWDRVTDDNLAKYADDETSHPLDRAFASATLAIRRFERLALQERIERGQRALTPGATR